jgi:acyl-CoA synthetase (AMP-forming)/AMP-acid ligase II
VLARNSPWYLLLYLAAAKAGVVLVPLNWRLLARVGRHPE